MACPRCCGPASRSAAPELRFAREHAARARLSPADFAAAMVWLVSEGAELSGRVVTLRALRERGVLQ